MLGSKKYSAKLMGRAGIVYTEGAKKMLLDSELLHGPQFDIVISLESIKAWEPPFQAENVSDDDIDKIKSNVVEALGDMRVDWQ